MKKIIASIVSLSLMAGCLVYTECFNNDSENLCINAASDSKSEYNGLVYSSNGSEITITGFTDDINPKKLVIPDTIEGLPVTKIEAWVFNDLQNLTSVKL